ncbi:hypothetical protein DFH29DRAFT_1069037 [Suillus ampliporus]|nr:hypothetical protein DFH29DRAFT_1069037 [Suillus ampliporus]
MLRTSLEGMRKQPEDGWDTWLETDRIFKIGDKGIMFKGKSQERQAMKLDMRANQSIKANASGKAYTHNDQWKFLSKNAQTQASSRFEHTNPAHQKQMETKTPRGYEEVEYTVYNLQILGRSGTEPPLHIADLALQRECLYRTDIEETILSLETLVDNEIVNWVLSRSDDGTMPVNITNPKGQVNLAVISERRVQTFSIMEEPFDLKKYLETLLKRKYREKKSACTGDIESTLRLRKDG